MSGFFSANVTSPFPDQNALFDAAKVAQAGQAYQSNQLHMQGQQMDLTAADHEQVGRLAAGLLAEPDLAKRADLYARGVGMLQAQNLAKYAPPTLPDEGVLRSLVNQSVPVTDQIKMGLYTPPGLTEALARASAPPPGYGGTGATATPATTPPGSGATIGQRQNNPGNLTFAGQPGAQPGQGNRFASFPDMPSGVAATADQLALYQTQHNINTVRGAVTRWVSDPKADLTSYIGDISKALGVGPDDKIDLTNPDVQAKFIQAQFPHESAGGGYVLNPADVAKGVQMAAANRGRAVQAPGTAIATAAPAGGVAARTGGTDTAGPGAGPVAPAPRVDSPGAPAAAGLKYNLSSQGAPGGTILGYLPNGNAVLAGPADTHTGITGWNADGTPIRGGAPAPAPTAQPGQPQPAATAQPGATPLPGTGVNSQQFQTALWKTQQAALLETQFPNSPAAKAKAAELRAEAALYMQADSVITLPNGIQVKALSGQHVDAAKPLPHYVYDAAQHAYIDTTGTNKPEFEPAQRDSAVAQRDVMELGPKVANGTATQAEQARYATAVETYRQPVLRENPVSKETVRVNTRELPAGFPEPPSLGGGGAPGGAGTGTPGGSNVVIQGLSPQQQQIERNKGRYDIAVEDLKHDRGEINAISDAGRGAQQDNLRVKEMQDILQHVDTGPGTENAAKFRAWIARWMPGELSRWDGSGANLSNPAAIEMFQKLGFVGAVTQERGSTPRGGYQATKMFQQFNPGAQLLTSSNQGLLAQRLIANQAEADYAQGAQDHYNTQRERLKSPEQDYEPLSSFDAKWQAQRNPQVYAAAIGALGGQDPEMWARGLSKDEIQRVKDVVTRADPNAVIHMPGEGKIVLQPNAKPLPPGFKVQ